MMNLRYDIDTKIEISGDIVSEVHTIENDVRVQTMRAVLKTRELHVIEALKKLGWTPPPAG